MQVISTQAADDFAPMSQLVDYGLQLEGRRYPRSRLPPHTLQRRFAGQPHHFTVEVRNLPPDSRIHIRCRMTASFRATATLALRNPLRFASQIPQALSVDHFATRVSKTLAAS